MTDQSPYLPWIVRDKDGNIIATYANDLEADDHADRVPGSMVSYDARVDRGNEVRP